MPYFYFLFYWLFIASFSLWPSASSFEMSLDNLGAPTPPSLPSLPASLPSDTTTLSAPLIPPSMPSIPSDPSAPSIPNIFTATQTTTSTLAPVTVTSGPLSTPSSTQGSTLGSGITTTQAPKGMSGTAPITTFNKGPLTKTLQEILTNSSSALSVYDNKMRALLRSGSTQQKSTILGRPHTDPTTSDQAFSNNSCTAGAQQITPKNKMRIPQAGHVMSKVAGMSFTHQRKAKLIKDSLFNNTSLEEEYKTLINKLKTYPSFIPIFTKFHILALSQLYQYLIGIYISLTMTHIDDLETYIVLEKAYGLNKKALIVQYLVSLVELQLNNALLELFPNLPKAFVVQGGLSSLQCDHLSRLDLMFVDMEQVVLATFGITAIRVDQWEVILKILTDPLYQNERALINETVLEQVATKLTTYIASQKTSSTTSTTHTPSFIGQLSQEEKSDLVDLLDILTTQFSLTQEVDDCKHIIAILQSKTSTPFTQGEYQLLKSLISSYILTKPLTSAIDTITSLQAKFNGTTPLSESITSEEFKFLHALLGFITLAFENISFNRMYTLSQVVQELLEGKKQSLSSKEQEIFTNYKTNSAYYKIKGRKLANDLQHNPLLLANLSEDQLDIFNHNITFYKNTHTLTPQDSSLLTQLAATINAKTSTATDLIPQQQSLYNTLLSFMASYTPGKFTESDAKKELTSVFGTQFNALIKLPLTQFEVASLPKFTPSELLIFYCGIQLAFRALQSQMDNHETDIQLFDCFNLYQTEIQEPLFNKITYDNYEDLLAAISLMDNPADSLDSLTVAQKNLILNLLKVLVNSSNSPKEIPGIFNKLFATLHQNQKLNSFTLQATPLTKVNLDALGTTIANPNFKISDLTSEENLFVTELMTSYQHFLLQPLPTKTPSSQTTTKGLEALPHPLNKEDDLVAQTMVSILHAEMNLKKNQNELVGCLNTLINFFSTYTATLHSTPSNSISVINKDFTQFAGYAHALAEQLKDTLPGTCAPALFIYDPKTLEHLAFLPSLAQTLVSTHTLFLPTQAIDMALLLHPVPSVMEPSSTNNQVILQKDVPYNIPSLLIPNPDNPASSFSPKFFFKDKNGKPFANNSSLLFKDDTSSSTTTYSLTNPQITWLGKTIFPSTDPHKKPNYQYYAIRPLEGEEGIYMNIPLLKKDQSDNKNVLARLYEQKIIPQPEWLNYPEGVIAMIRACLGDFLTGLMIDDTIFDPVINYLLRYTLVNSNHIPIDAGIPGAPQPFTLEDLQKTLPLYETLSKKELIDTYVGPIASHSQGAST